MRQNSILVSFIVVFVLGVSAKKEFKPEHCEVCFGVIDKFSQKLKDLEHSERTDPLVLESKFREYCKDSKGKENRFCYYLGGLEESATGILNSLTKPLSSFYPTARICENLKKMDQQICDLRYEKVIDLKTVDLKKLKVRDLKDILTGWNEQCEGCLEKPDFIKRIEQLKSKHVHGEL